MEVAPSQMEVVPSKMEVASSKIEVSPFFVDFHDLRTFVAIYILSRFTHFFRNFFLAKVAFSATSHVFCMCGDTVDSYWEIAKLELGHWGVVIYNQIVTWTAFAILAIFFAGGHIPFDTLVTGLAQITTWLVSSIISSKRRVKLLLIRLKARMQCRRASIE